MQDAKTSHVEVQNNFNVLGMLDYIEEFVFRSLMLALQWTLLTLVDDWSDPHDIQAGFPHVGPDRPGLVNHIIGAELGSALLSPLPIRRIVNIRQTRALPMSRRCV